VQFTASQEFVDLLDEARDLLGHESPRLGLPDVQLRALRALVKELRARKRAATARAQPSTPSGRSDAETAEAQGRAPAREPSIADTAPERGSCLVDAAPDRESGVASVAAPRRGNRHVPAPTRRAVFDRDDARCAFQDERGERCRETRGLEVHHRLAYALGGSMTLDNLELRCRAHNTLAAEEDFGRKHMARMRGLSDEAAPERGFVDA